MRYALGLLVGVLFLIEPFAVVYAQKPSNEQVEQRVDDITKAPKYDWLREGEPPSNWGDVDFQSDSTGTHSPLDRKRYEQTEDCGYEPDIQSPPPEREPPSGDGCGGPEPGAPNDAFAGDGCGCSPNFGDCGCSPNIGDCGCSPVIGNCGNCGSIGAASGILGYVFAALALAVIIFFVVRSIVDARKNKLDTAILSDGELEDPMDVRVSAMDHFSWDTLMNRAKEAAANGNYKSAVGFAYLAGLSKLHRAGFVELDRSTTNLKIIESTKRKNGPYLAADVLLGHFEDLFFGEREATRERWKICEDVVTVQFATIGSEDDHEIS